MNSDRASRACRFLNPFLACVLVGLAILLAAPPVPAHSPVLNADLSDWCIGAFSNTAPGGGRVEDSSASLSCGNCSVATNKACTVNTDCSVAHGGLGGSCINLGSKVEVGWWDNRTDGAVNDLATFATTQDNTNLYFAAELWVDPDPVSLPFAEVGIDFRQGGLDVWHDPLGNFVAPGHCSASTDRGCTSNPDCHFCAISTEPFPSTRKRTCGSNGPAGGGTGLCSLTPGDVCITTETCQDIGTYGLQRVGQGASEATLIDHLLLFDFSIWLIGVDLQNAVLLMQPGTVVDPTSPWDPVLGCPVDSPDDPTSRCDFVPQVNPGQSGGSGGPPGAVEVAIPWSAFGCTGCPGACNCPGFGPGMPFRFTAVVARGTLTLDFRPDGPIEDVFSEAVAGTTTTSTDDCPGMGTGTTLCEIGDGHTDAMIPRLPTLPHEATSGGEAVALTMSRGVAPSITLDWFGSCATGDTDYEVYEGMIGSWNSHVPVPSLACTTGGATTATFNAAPGPRYYLVVPTAGATEGSHGLGLGGAQRPVGPAPCVVQALGTCP